MLLFVGAKQSCLSTEFSTGIITVKKANKSSHIFFSFALFIIIISGGRAAGVAVVEVDVPAKTVGVVPMLRVMASKCLLSVKRMTVVVAMVGLSKNFYNETTIQKK